jgi:hypothetical protein
MQYNLVRRDTESHIILIKVIVYQKGITIVNFDAPGIGALNLVMHILLDLKIQFDPTK